MNGHVYANHSSLTNPVAKWTKKFLCTPLLLVQVGINDSTLTPNYLNFVLGADAQTLGGSSRTWTCYLIIYSFGGL